MLNLPETLLLYKQYLSEYAIFGKIVGYSIAVFPFLDFLRSQIAEITLLQLMPGLYLTIIFSYFVFLLFGSVFLTFLPTGNDKEKKRGTKTVFRLECKLEYKGIFTLLLIGLYFLMDCILPISFDSFNSYGVRTIESLWSIDEFIDTEWNLGVLLILLLQIPLIISSPIYSENLIIQLPKYSRDYIFLICILSGFLTPTVDIGTQLTFIIVGISIYILINTVLNKNSSRILSI